MAEENPFLQEKLTPNHLALLFPAVFYQSDESLALHLSGRLTLTQSHLLYQLRLTPLTSQQLDSPN